MRVLQYCLIGIFLLPIQYLGGTMQGVIGYSMRPLTQPTTIVKDRPFRATFEEFAVSGDSRFVTAKGLILRDAAGDGRTEFFDGSGERSRTVVLDARTEGALYLLYPDVRAGMKVPSQQKTEDRLKWTFAGADLVEIGEDKVSGMNCRRYRAENPAGDFASEVCISEMLQAVLQEKTQSKEGVYFWELRDISTDAPAKDLFRPPANFRVLSPNIPRP
jgi:hypothetical protein